ncbi:cbb3-type cytochrome c oxidase subunit 3 [Sulfitobacter sp. F26169L]|uniref:cbb3-type cytochrome c oxidase subunit 3 n=1 Tax=Sulfitobacter sp. F26169L TaxID=2996015 RepID=UPI002260D526|nr:cbb3-type cytochrome c oxidase subunit 3 [Sulfitobacter sp. F26169L]MCX7567326.1 cbb3-type cytochrome c oxidase subunit 3 [Sulfitobacter sp. F26169L]
METYSLLREIADSWVLLAMFIFFAGAAIWAFLPSQSKARKDASMIPFRNDNDGNANKRTDDAPKQKSRKQETKSHD